MMPALDSTKTNFINAMLTAIGTQIPDTGKILTIAWAAFESDWGRTTGFLKANNPFNITAGSHWSGDTVPGPDTEYDAQGKVKNITQAWRKYNNISDAVGDMVSFLTISNSNNKAGRDALFSGDIGFVQKLYAGKYFTLPPDKYQAGVQSTLSDVQRLNPLGVA